MTSHRDKLRTAPPDAKYKANHDHIFGPKKAAKPRTPAEEEKYQKARMESHKQEVRDGKKDAQYYLDHEVRVSANPNYQPRPRVDDEVYKKNFLDIDWSSKG